MYLFLQKTDGLFLFLNLCCLVIFTAKAGEAKKTSDLTITHHKQTGDEQKKRNTTHQSMHDLLSETSGYLQQSGSLGSQLSMSLRGSGSHQNQIQLDGIPLQTLRSQALDLSLFPLDMLNQVSVKRGMGEGSGGQSGVVGLSLAPLKQGMQWQSQLTANTERTFMGGGHISYRNTKGGIGGYAVSSFGPGTYPYVGEHGNLKKRQYADHQRVATLIQGLWTPSSFTLQTLFGGGWINRGQPGPEGFNLEGRRTDNLLLYSQVKLTTLLKTKNNPIYTQMHLYSTHHRFQFNETQPLWQSQRSANFQSLDHRVGIQNQQRTLLFSFLEMEVNESFEWNQLTTLDSSYTRLIGAVTPSFRVRILETKSHHQIRVLSALRWDWNYDRSAAWVPSFGIQGLFFPSSSFIQHRKANQHQSPRSRLTHLQVPHKYRLQCTFKGSQTFRDPGVDELFYQAPGWVANPNLRQEQGYWIEGGCLTRLKISNAQFGRLTSNVRLTGFWQDYSRLILYVPLDPYRIQAQDLWGADIKGLEFSLSLRGHPSPQLKLTPFYLQTHFTLQEHQLTQSPFTPLPLRPTFQGWTKLTLYLRPAHIWTKVQYRSALFTDRFAQRSLKSITLVHLGLGRQGTHWGLEGSFRDLFNRSPRDFILQPRPGRSVWLTLRYIY